MRSAAVQETLDRVQPLVVADAEGVEFCPWPYYHRTEKGVIAAVIWELDLHEECRRFGFDDYFIHKDRDNLHHELMLLGPDSPGEYVYSFDSRLIGDDTLEHLGRDMNWWLRQMYVIRAIQTGEATDPRCPLDQVSDQSAECHER